MGVVVMCMCGPFGHETLPKRLYKKDIHIYKKTLKRILDCVWFLVKRILDMLGLGFKKSKKCFVF